MGKISCTLLLALWALVPQTALAAPTGSHDARALLQQARKRFGRGELAGARSLLTQALKRTSEDALVGQIHLLSGLTWAGENQPEKAREAFAKALRHDPALVLDTRRYKPAFVTLFDEVRRTLVGTLEVETSGPAGTLQVDGSPRGKTPYSGVLLKGSHQVVLTTASGALKRLRVVIEAGKTTRLLLDTSGAVKASKPPPVAEPPQSQPQQQPPQPEPRKRLWTWLAAGGAVLTAGLAIGFGVAAKADQDDACALLAGSGSCDGRSTLADPSERSTYDSLRSNMDAKALTSTLFWGSAAVLAVTAAVLFYFEGKPQTERSAQLDASLSRLSLKLSF